MSERPYSRVYWEVMEDPKFDGVREDVRHIGTWSLMLVVADMAWPAPAFVPPVPRQSVKLLADRGLVDLLPGNRFRIHGLDRERSDRSERARVSGRLRRPLAERTLSERSASAEQPLSERSAIAERTLSERSASRGLAEDETRTSVLRAGAREGSDGPTYVDGDPDYAKVMAWLAERSVWVTSPRQQADLARDIHRKGPDAVIAAMAAIDGAEDAAQFVYGAHNALFPLSGSVTSRPPTKAETEALAARQSIEAARRARLGA